MPEVRAEQRLLTGWGGTSPTAATVVPGDVDLASTVSQPHPRGVLARGLGRSYGDAAQNSGGLVIDPSPGSVELLQDGSARVSAGTDLHTLIRAVLPRGWFVPVTPGTRYVTIGGAIACDVHGKNHHRAGSFGAHVRSLDLVTADGSSRTLRPDDHDPRVQEQFWATVGGMGLTGVITSAVISLTPVQSGHMVVDTERTADLDDVMVRLREADRSHTYTVAWVDATARGRHLGRSVITLGEHAGTDELPRQLRGRGPTLPESPRAEFPFTPPVGLITPLTARAFNEMWYRKAPRHRTGEIQTIGAFFHPLDGVRHWNRVYGSRGLVQYQFVVPDGAEQTLVAVLEHFTRAEAPCFLSVLKRFGPANPAPLSFPMPGWTLALDVPASPRLGALLQKLDRLVLEAGGRLYLAKDARAGAQAVRQMYPRLEEFEKVRARMDPDRVFRSDLARRLGL
ncbi:MAG TPA: FAD-binding oxidoreductase [Marmoricola sp.]|nr:FAD-binding oxidoreductase [Marmoricola sp.]